MVKSIVSFVAIIVVIALLAGIVLFGVNIGTLHIPNAQEGVKLSIDLAGGSVLTFEATIPAGTSEDQVRTGMDSVRDVIQRRLTMENYTEAAVYLSGSNRITVEIPRESNPEKAAQLLGTVARLAFKDADGVEKLAGSDVESAQYSYSATDETGFKTHHVVLKFKSESAQKFTDATREAAARTDGNNYIAITLDDQVQSAPYVDAQYAAAGIPGDSAIITVGGDNEQQKMEQAKSLASLISSGQLVFQLELIQQSTVNASLGARALQTSILAGIIGLGLVLLFMLLYYRLPGAVSGIALILYVCLVLVTISIAGVNLSLPGIAGIILSIGMAVDANVIIYERLKEELRSGKTLRSSVAAAFHRAFSAIIDSNITTLIAAVVLWIFGTGPIVGFAMTLFIGVVLSMFTALVITRLLLNAIVGMNVKNNKLLGV